MMQQRLYASHWLGHEGATVECHPDLNIATLMPFGQSVRCARLGCEGDWVLAQTTDASEALSGQPEPSPDGPIGPERNT